MFSPKHIKNIRNGLRSVLILFSLLFATVVSAQQYIHSIKPLSSEDGFNGQIKYSALIDRDGFLWFSSFYGVDRYDGTEVMNIVPPKDLPKDMQILHLFESQNGELWMILGQSNGLPGKFKCYHINTKNGALTDWKVFLKEKAVFHEDEVYRYRITTNGLNVILKNGDLWILQETFKKIRRLDNLEDYHLHNWVLHTDGSMLYGKGNFLIKEDASNTIEKQFDGEVIGVLEDDLEGYQIYVLKNNKLLAHILDDNFNILSSYPQIHIKLPFKEKTIDGNYLLQVNGQVQLLDKDQEIIWDLAKTLDMDKDQYLYQWVYQSPRSNLIIVQGYDHPYIINIKASPFKNYLNDRKSPRGMRGITVTNDGIIYANSGRTYGIEPSKGIIDKIRPFDLERSEFIHPMQIYFDELRNALWMISYHKAVAQSLDSEENYVYTLEYNSKISSIVSHSIFDHVLALTSNGIYSLDTSCHCPVKYNIDSTNHPINNESLIELEIRNDRGYIVSTNGWYTWDIAQNIIVDHKPFPAELKESKILDLHFDFPNEVWFATEGSGVYQWNHEDNRITTYNTENGLSRNIVYAIKKDSLGRFWMPTTYGLNCLDPATNIVQNFLPKDGLPHFEFNTHSHFQDKQGHLYFGSLDGFTVFNPNRIEKYTSGQTNTLITEIKLHDIETGAIQEILPDENSPVVFHNRKEILELKFSTINLTNTSSPKFQYKFDGNGELWQNYNGTSLSFTNLNPGTHRLKIRGLDDHNSWSTKEASLQIQVPTPFFESMYFWFLLTFLVVGAVYLYARWRIQYLRKSEMKLMQEVEKRTQRLQESKALIEKQAEELTKVDQLKSRFFTNISHELRTPLTLILNPLKSIRQKQYDSQTIKRNVDIAHTASLQLQKLVDRILGLSAFDAGSLKLKENNVRLLHLTKNVIEPHKSVAHALGISFEIEFDPKSDTIIKIDLEKIREIIDSLISNALKFCAEGDKIAVGLKLENELLTFSCQDSGIGISTDEQTKIFSDYYQTVHHEVPAQGGLGIGLPMSKAFAKIMNGHLVVHSIKGQGSTFTLTVPCKIVDPTAEFLIPAPAAILDGVITATHKESQTGQKCILLVEDHKMMSQLVSNVLQPHYNVLSASNGKIALELLFNANGKEQEVDLIITDWMMPKMDGPAFLKELKSKNETIPVIMLTARASQEDKLSMLKIGVDDYLIKPFDPEELRIRILNLLNNQRERKEALKKVLKQPNPEFDMQPSATDKWLKQLEYAVTENLNRSEFSVLDLASAMNIGDRQLNRKIKSLTGLTPGNYIKECRLLKARHLLENQQFLTVSEVCFAVGFNTQEYFSKIFYQRFGKLPSSYL